MCLAADGSQRRHFSIDLHSNSKVVSSVPNVVLTCANDRSADITRGHALLVCRQLPLSGGQANTTQYNTEVDVPPGKLNWRRCLPNP